MHFGEDYESNSGFKINLNAARLRPQKKSLLLNE